MSNNFRHSSKVAADCEITQSPRLQALQKMLVAARPGKVSKYSTILTGVKFHKVSQSERQPACESHPDVSVKIDACPRTR